MFSDVFDALCPILDLIGDVLGFLGGGGDYEEDGCFTDEAGIFGTLLNVVTFGGAWYVYYGPTVCTFSSILLT